MKSGFYIKTAWNNIKKNYRFYIPQMLTGMGLLACLYIVFTLKSDKRIESIVGGEYMPMFMGIGTAVISLLSVIIIFYTNSFLMKQRKREYGLYNILGMEKKHIGRIMFWETVISGSASIVSGSVFGLLFYKLSSLLICNLFRTDIIFGFDFITPKTIIPPAVFFLVLYLLTFVINRISIARLKPVEMMKTRQMGEKEPKVKWAMLTVGIITLAAGYLISLLTTNPLSALLLFFAAVFLVIIGTYFLFTAGSIFVLKLLKKNKGYYYNKKHFTSVSGLIYRMKQNAVGLASICILATGVLVMISTTVSLYSGMQETLQNSYPQDLYLSCDWKSDDGVVNHVPSDELSNIVESSADKYRIAVKSIESQEYLEVSYIYQEKSLKVDNDSYFDISGLTNVTFITEDAYMKLTGKSLGLTENEIALDITSLTIGTTDIPKDTIIIHGITYNIKNDIDDFPIETSLAMISPSSYGIVVSDENVLNNIYQLQKRDYGVNASEMTERIAVTYDSRDDASACGSEIQSEITAGLENYIYSQADFDVKITENCKCYWEAREAVIGMYGTLLFLGIILGIVCLFATILIIYYKQISEGYEDRERYQIMKKVGISDDEIKKTIRSQTLLVFFLPLIFAGINTAFAFPITNKLLHLILLSSTSLFVACMFITFAVFAVIYVIIYSMTAKTYYKIVH